MIGAAASHVVRNLLLYRHQRPGYSLLPTWQQTRGRTTVLGELFCPEMKGIFNDEMGGRKRNQLIDSASVCTPSLLTSKNGFSGLQTEFLS